jgi:acetyl-CoA carboxylase carboxyltransferase component
MSDEMVKAYAKKYAGQSLTELEGMVDEWVKGSDQRNGILLAISLLKAKEKAKADEDTERRHRELGRS